jgi:hypothetical protein
MTETTIDKGALEAARKALNVSAHPDFGATYNMEAAIRAYLAALPVSREAVGVKALEWRVVDRAGAMQATSQVMGYTIEPTRGGRGCYVTRNDGKTVATKLPSMDAGKAAADADHETYVRALYANCLSALASHTVDTREAVPEHSQKVADGLKSARDSVEARPPELRGSFKTGVL